MLYWLVVWNIFHFSIYWECHHPNWRTHIFQRGRSTTKQYSISPFNTMDFLYGMELTDRPFWRSMDPYRSSPLCTTKTSPSMQRRFRLWDWHDTAGILGFLQMEQLPGYHDLFALHTCVLLKICLFLILLVSLSHWSLSNMPDFGWGTAF